MSIHWEPDEVDLHDQAVERELIRQANQDHLEDKRWLNMCIAFWILFLLFVGLGLHKWMKAIWQ